MDVPTIIAKINEWIAEIESDPRVGYPPANVQVNAPLALIQVALENQRAALKSLLKFIQEGSSE